MELTIKGEPNEIAKLVSLATSSESPVKDNSTTSLNYEINAGGRRLKDVQEVLEKTLDTHVAGANLSQVKVSNIGT